MKQKAYLLLICALILLTPAFAFAAKTHKVRKNETIYSLARKYRVSVDDIRSANNLVGTQIRKGDMLVIPPRVQTASGDRSASASTYKVKKGDTLQRIARKTGVSLAELKRLNGAAGKKLRLGQLIALREVNAQEEERATRLTRKQTARFKELFSEEQSELTLAELTDFDPDRPVDLHKSIASFTDDNADLLRKKAYGFLGTRYRFGGNSRNGLDCSSFVQQVFREMDIRLPRTAREQFVVGDQVALSDLRKGDLVFFRTYASFPSHVGIYLGDNKMIHASSRDRQVVVSRMNTPYYRARFIGAKRIQRINGELPMFEDLLLGVQEETEEDAITNDTLGISLNN